MPQKAISTSWRLSKKHPAESFMHSFLGLFFWGGGKPLEFVDICIYIFTRIYTHTLKILHIFIYIYIFIYYFWLFKIDPDFFFKMKNFASSSCLANQLMWIYGCYEWQNHDWRMLQHAKKDTCTSAMTTAWVLGVMNLN